MPVTVERFERVMGISRDKRPMKKGFAKKWLGSFKGVLPESKTSTEFIKELRGSSYGKFKQKP